MPFLHLDPSALEQAREVMTGSEAWHQPAVQPLPQTTEVEPAEQQPAAPSPIYPQHHPEEALASGWMARLLAISGNLAAAAHA